MRGKIRKNFTPCSESFALFSADDEQKTKSAGTQQMSFLEKERIPEDAGSTMGKKSLRKNKTIYQLSREKAGLTRKEAAEKIGFLSEHSLEKKERDKSYVDPADVLAMEEVYKDYTLSSHHCSQNCAIGQQYVKAAELKSLAQIALHAQLALMNLESRQPHLLELAGKDTQNEEEMQFLEEYKQLLLDLGQAGRELDVWLRTKKSLQTSSSD